MGVAATGLRIQFNLQAGKENIADILSRKPVSKPPKVNQGEEFVNYIISNSIPKSILLEDIKAAYGSDPPLLQTMKYVKSGIWKSSNSEIAQYYRLRNELTLVDGVLLRNRKLVIPQGLRNQVLRLAHEGHLGVVKSKARLRSKV